MQDEKLTLANGSLDANYSLSATESSDEYISTDDAKQIVYLDFDGEKTGYRNGELDISIDNITVENSGLSEDRIREITAQLNEIYAGKNITFTVTRPQGDNYSTVYVGKTDAFDPYGNFTGLAETIDSGNKIKNDNAFVLMNASSGNDDIISVISHEVDHIAAGMQHHVCNGTLDDYAVSYTVNGSSLGISTPVSSAAILGTLSTTSDDGQYDYISFSVASSGVYSLSNYAKCLFGRDYAIRTSITNAGSTVLSFSTSDLKSSDTATGEVYLTAGNRYYMKVMIASTSVSYTTTKYSYYLTINPKSSTHDTPRTKPDLTISALTSSSSTVLLSRIHDITLTFTITNQGNAASGSSVAYIYDGSTKIGSANVSSIAAGKSVTYTYTVKKSQLTTGTHTFKVETDGADSVSESNENNNVRTCTVKVKAADLRISLLQSYATTVKIGSSAKLSFAVQNIGDVASAPSTVFIYNGSQKLGSIAVGIIAAGASKNCTYTIAASKLSAGSHTIKIVADATSKVKEDVESNNTRNCCIIVQAPDLKVSEFTVSAATVAYGSSVKLNFTIKNEGSLAAKATKAYIYDGDKKNRLRRDCRPYRDGIQELHLHRSRQ